VAALKRGADIDAFVRRPDPAYPVVLVYGPNGGLVRERADRLVSLASGAGADAFQLVRLEGDDIAGDSLRLADEANTVGLFGGRRIVRVRAGSRNLAPSVQPLVSAPPRDALVVIEAGDLANRNPLRVLVEGARAAIALPCFADEPRDLAALIDEMLSEAGLRIGREAREALSGHLGSDRQLARREIEKLVLYCAGQQEVALDDVEAAMADTAVVSTDPVVDAAFLGDAEGADRGVARLLAEGEDPGVVVGAALRHAMLLHRSRVALDSGAGIDEVERAARLFFKRKPAFQRQVNRWSATALEPVIGLLREAQASCRRNATLGPAILARALMTVAVRVRGRQG
jgi:DNA polymerase-3 subunit delta